MFSRVPFLLVLTAAFAVSVSFAHADEAKKADEKKPAGQKKPDAKPKAEEPDIYTISKDATVKELQAAIVKIERFRPRTQQQYINHLKKRTGAIVAAADALLAAEDVTEEVAAAAVSSKLRTLMSSRNLADKTAFAAASKAASADKRAKVARIGQQFELVAATSKLNNPSKDEQEAFVADAVKLFEGDVTFATMGLIMEIPKQMQRNGQEELAAAYYVAMQAPVSKSDNERIAAYSDKFPGMARKLTMVGNTLDIKGTLLNGEQVDWAAYKGKVVLVDFWATWCGPCIRELPNVKDNYAKYHSKGFEVLGISLDTDGGRVEKFVEAQELAWDTLFSADKEAQGWNHPMANYYGVTGIPMAVLVGKDGKVITLNARGATLGNELKKILGEPDPVEKASETGGEDKESAADSKK